MKAISQAWLDAASDDLRAVERLANDPELTNITAFHAQQSVEKCLKAIVEEHDLGVLKTHSLLRLFGLCSSHIAPSHDDHNTVIILDKLYIDARYPGERGLLPEGKPGLEDAEAFVEFARRIREMCLELLNT
jgi:HEPN domain-containing protein